MQSHACSAHDPGCGQREWLSLVWLCPRTSQHLSCVKECKYTQVVPVVSLNRGPGPNNGRQLGAPTTWPAPDPQQRLTDGDPRLTGYTIDESLGNNGYTSAVTIVGGAAGCQASPAEKQPGDSRRGATPGDCWRTMAHHPPAWHPCGRRLSSLVRRTTSPHASAGHCGQRLEVWPRDCKCVWEAPWE